VSSEGFILEDINVEVDFISGADLFVRKDVLCQVGGFDEDFFLFYEEVDLCKRIKNAGFKLEIITEAKIVHLMGKTMNVSFQKFKWFEASRYVFLRKYYSKLFIIFSKVVFIFRYLFLGLKYAKGEWFNRAKYIYKV
jgi:GT2 family glycosyltransferase